MDAVCAIAAKHSSAVIGDAAQARGAVYAGNRKEAAGISAQR